MARGASWRKGAAGGRRESVMLHDGKRHPIIIAALGNEENMSKVIVKFHVISNSGLRVGVFP